MISLVLSILLLANPYLAKGIEQVRALDEQTAVKSLIEAKNWNGNTTGELAQVHMWLGLAYAGLAQESEARESFRAALLLDDALELPTGTSPVVTGWWEELGGHRPQKPILVPTAQPPPTQQIVEARPQSRPVLLRWPFWTGLVFSVAALAAFSAGVYYGVAANSLRSTAERTERAFLADAIDEQAMRTAQQANWLMAAGGLGVLLAAGSFALNFIAARSADNAPVGP